jgi:RIO-like serine/threonine protein kinase
MELVRENKQKKRKTYKLVDRYRKVWDFIDLTWLEEHVRLLNTVVPDYVLEHGYNDATMWIDFKIIPGTPAGQFEHTEEFIKKIYQFCLDNIKATSPYVHGDWVLSNIIVDGETMSMCDWDNLNIYPKEDVIKKLRNDLRSAFGEKFDKVINDSTSI